MNSDELDKLRQQKASEEKSDELPEDDLKTPTIEELTFPGHQRVVKMIYSTTKLKLSSKTQKFCHIFLNS